MQLSQTAFIKKGTKYYRLQYDKKEQSKNVEWFIRMLMLKVQF